MKQFIEFTDINWTKFSINYYFIFSILPEDDGCCINLSPHGFKRDAHIVYHVKESYQTVLDLIGKAE